MTAVRLTRLWLCDVLDPTNALALVMVDGSQRSWPSKASVREGAQGRRRLVTSPRGDSRVWPLQLAPMPVSLAEQLAERAGSLHWARDVLGGKVCCFWDDAPQVGMGAIGTGGTQLVRVTMTLQQVTRAERGQALPIVRTGPAGGS